MAPDGHPQDFLIYFFIVKGSTMRFISKKDFRNLVQGLLGEMTLYGPVKKRGHSAYAEINSFDELAIGTAPTHLSAKEFFFPPKETLLEFDIEKKEVSQIIQNKK